MKRATPNRGGQPMRELPAEHLDRAWPGTDRATSQQVADERRFPSAVRLVILNEQAWAENCTTLLIWMGAHVFVHSPFELARDVTAI